MKYVFCILHPVCLYLFSLSPSLYSLRPLSLSLLLFRSRPTLGRTVPPREPGPAQGFFLFKVAFFLATVLTRGFRLRVSASFSAPLDVETLLCNLLYHWYFWEKKTKETVFFPPRGDWRVTAANSQSSKTTIRFTTQFSLKIALQYQIYNSTIG